MYWINRLLRLVWYTAMYVHQTILSKRCISITYVSWRSLLPQKRYFELFWRILRVGLGVRTCELFLCFAPSVFRARGSIEFTSLSYIIREFNRFLHQGWADYFSVKRRSKGRTQNFFKIVQNTTFEAKGRQFRVIHCLWLIHAHI